MTDNIGGPRYGYEPTAAFAATRASADLRRTRTAAPVSDPLGPPPQAYNAPHDAELELTTLQAAAPIHNAHRVTLAR